LAAYECKLNSYLTFRQIRLCIDQNIPQLFHVFAGFVWLQSNAPFNIYHILSTFFENIMPLRGTWFLHTICVISFVEECTLLICRLSTFKRNVISFLCSEFSIIYFLQHGKNTFISGKDITQLALHCYTHIQWESRGTQEWLRLDQF